MLIYDKDKDEHDNGHEDEVGLAARLLASLLDIHIYMAVSD
jgi:hypothetical protein